MQSVRQRTALDDTVKQLTAITRAWDRLVNVKA
jgi:hypothetical protein